MRETPRKEGQPNRDPISGAPGAHPVGTGAGAVAGAAAGAAAGTAVGGPAGTLVGGVSGAGAGGVAGRGAPERLEPPGEGQHGRKNHREEPYYVEGREYD